MRQKLNDNPLTQAIALGALAVLVGFMLLTRVMGGSGPQPGSEAPPSTDTSATSTAPVTPGVAPTSSESSTAASPDVVPGAAPPAVPAGPTSDFKAGPGLPGSVADAYADGKVVTLLVFRERGIDDQKVKAIVERLRDRGDTAVEVTKAAGIAKYSRITEGVDVDRVPALIVIRPKKLSQGGMPEATVSYGFRDPQTVEQAVRDALYKGRDNLPYYPR